MLLRIAMGVVAMGLVSVTVGIWWNKVPASFWARTRHRSVGGASPRHMMDFVFYWVYNKVEMVCMCDHAM
jgi:hypothetical protein